MTRMTRKRMGSWPPTRNDNEERDTTKEVASNFAKATLDKSCLVGDMGEGDRNTFTTSR
jgi:hypothetical protein